MKIYQGTIISCDEKNSIYKYLVESKERIEYVGNTLPDKYNKLPIFELGKTVLIPAFVDTHIHYSSYSMFASLPDIRSLNCFDDILDFLLDYDRNNREKFILSFGCSAHNVKEKKLISKTELDRAFPNKPVMIVKYDGNASIVNTKMIDMLPDKIKSMRGFHFDRGELNQEAFFFATDFITKKIPSLKLIKNMIKGIDLLADKGIGMIHTVEGVGFPKDMDVDLSIFLAKGLQNPFQMRIFFQTMDIVKVQKRKLPRIGGCFATALDGCFGSEDAALLHPYKNDSQNKGVLFYTQDEVNEFAKNANRAGLQIEMHAIGDAAFVQAVNALEYALNDFERKDHRHTIIHCCLPTQKELKKISKLGIGIAVQPSFINWDLEPYEYIESILGKRADSLSPLKTMLDMGIKIYGGSDAPCTIPDPIDGIYCACNHYIEKESLSVIDALKMYTINGCWASFDEKDRGSLEIGKIADMTILSENPLSINKRDIKRIKVEKLILSGKEYKKNQGLVSTLINSISGLNPNH